MPLPKESAKCWTSEVFFLAAKIRIRIGSATKEYPHECWSDSHQNPPKNSPPKKSRVRISTLFYYWNPQVKIIPNNKHRGVRISRWMHWVWCRHLAFTSFQVCVLAYRTHRPGESCTGGYGNTDFWKKTHSTCEKNVFLVFRKTMNQLRLLCFFSPINHGCQWKTWHIFKWRFQ